MKTYLKLNGEAVTAIVTSSVAPAGYVSISAELIPPELFADLNAYTFDGQYFHKRTASEEESKGVALMQLRMKRDRLLSSCDWTQAPDAPVDRSAWAVYRQSLRDLPSNTIDPRSPVWPTPPA